MKALIICFSQTGNTRAIAGSIGDGLKEAAGHCDLCTLDAVDTGSIASYDLVGIGAPVFYYKEPFHVRAFIRSLPDLDGQHWFVFCTHGNVPGNYFPSMINLLEERHACIMGWHHSYAGICLPFYPTLSYTSGHPDGIDHREARTFGADVARRCAEAGSTGKTPALGVPPVSSEEWLRDSKQLSRELLAQVLPKLRLDPETCIRCRTCEDECPVGGIDIDREPPRLQDPCIHCWRCVNVCPTLSMDADWTPLFAMAPANFARYRQELERAAARGEFRWLTDPDAVDPCRPLIEQRRKEIK